MRAPILGVCLGHDLDKMKAYIRASTRLTHTDERAYEGSLVIALAAHEGATKGADGIDPASFLKQLREQVHGEQLCHALDAVATALESGQEPAELAQMLGWERGVSGYINHTVPASLFCWLRYPDDLRRAIEAVIRLGGDADTTGAITGALAGATVGREGIPETWLKKLIEWPRSLRWISRLAKRLEEHFGEETAAAPPAPLRLFWPGILLRNAFFFGVILFHGFRRLFPPY